MEVVYLKKKYIECYTSNKLSVWKLCDLFYVFNVIFLMFEITFLRFW